jgi:hypothetical protein
MRKMSRLKDIVLSIWPEYGNSTLDSVTPYEWFPEYFEPREPELCFEPIADEDIENFFEGENQNG